MIKGLLIDFDGTMCDSIPQLRQYFKKFMSTHGAPDIDETFDELNGRPIADCIEILVQQGKLNGSPDQLTKDYQAGLDEVLSDCPPKSGLEYLLLQARTLDIRVAIVTSNRTAPVLRWLGMQGLSQFVEEVVGCDSVSAGKPDPEPYQCALALLDLIPSECLAVEDSESGWRSALSAQVPTVVLVRQGPPGTSSAATLDDVARIISSGTSRIGHFHEMPEIKTVESIVFSRAEQEVVNRVWKKHLDTDQSLFDGPMTFIRRFTHKHIEVFQGSYRFWFAQHLGEIHLGLTPLAVSGAIRIDGCLLVCKRGSSVFQNPNQWEPAPSGTVSLPLLEDSAGVLRRQLMEEAREELNLKESELHSPRVLEVLFDHQSHVVDVVVEMQCTLTPLQFRDRWETRQSDEYVSYQLVRDSKQAQQFANHQIHDLLATFADDYESGLRNE